MTKERLITDLARLRERIHELEKTEEDKNKYLVELNDTKAMFEGLFEFAPDGIVVADGERGQRALRESERVGDVHEDLAVEVVLACQYERRH